MANTISVITPMYNVAAWIECCVRSLFSQTLHGFEIIFVDDCSTDDTLTRLQNALQHLQPARPDITVKLLRHDRNRGVAAARNTALAEAEGTFVYSVDADDHLVPEALETLAQASLDPETDVVVCEWSMVFGKNVRHMHQPDVTTGEELFTKVARGALRWNLWLILFRKSLCTANRLHFTEGANMGEDLMLLLCMSLHARKVHVIHKPLYQYVQTNGEALTKRFLAHRAEVDTNVETVAQYLAAQDRPHLLPLIHQLQLTVKLPLLISPHRSDYETWLLWYPEANASVLDNPDCSWRTRMLQQWAVRRHYGLLRLYYYVVTKVVYGIVFR